MNYDAAYRNYASYLEPALDRALVGIYPPLKEAMGYSLLNGGKRLRPVLTLACCDVLGGEMRRAVPFAVAIEMIHTYSLIHDDLPCMDDDDIRRGKPSNHRVYGEGMAVLAGDALLSLAFEIMAEQVVKNPDNRAFMHAMLFIARSCGVGGMVSGQARDIANSGMDISANELRRLHTEKTGALISAACVAGALIGEANDVQRKALESYGQQLGLAFQIADDILDDAEDERMPNGRHDGQEQSTYVTMYGRDMAKQWARRSANLAIEALAPFDETFEFLRKTAVFAVIRRE